MTEVQSGLKIEQVYGTPPALAGDELTSLANVYADVFAGNPWNEYTRCSVEDKFFGRETEPGDPCACGQSVLGQAYPLAETRDHIQGELSRPDGTLFLVRTGEEDRIVGFSWAFSYGSPEEFAEEKYSTPEMQTAVSDLLGRTGVKGAFYYLSETGILDNPAFRGQGISLRFHEQRFRIAEEKGLSVVQRTSSEGPMYRTSQKAGMEQIMGPEVEVDTVSRTFRRTGAVVNDALDKENEARVLFLKRQDQ